MDPITLFLYILVALISVFYFVYKIRFTYWKNHGIPHLEPSIPYGNLNPGKKIHSVQIFDKIYNTFKGKTLFAGAYFFLNPIAIILDLDLIKNILIKDFNYFIDRGMYYNEKDDPLSAHLFNVDGDKWKILRSKLTPTFTTGKMKFMFPTIVEVGKEFQNTISEMIKINSEIEIKELLARFTTDVIGTCAFGIECNSLKNPDAEFRTYGRLAFELPQTITGRYKRNLIQQFTTIARILKVKRTKPEVRKFFMGVVKETVEMREKNKIRRNDFMDLLIELKNSENEKNKQLTFNEIAAQAFVFFLAGFETSSTTMGFCLYELAINQDIQDRLRKEINSVIEKHEGKFTYEAMMDMTYLEQVINESLRKYPPVIVLQRRAIQDYKVPNSNYVIEKGRTVFIPAYSIQHDPKYYPNPDKFDPERFTSEAVKNRHPMAFLSFGDGPRNCIGLRFGRMQARIGLVSILRNFKILPSSKTPKTIEYSRSSAVLSPKGGFWLKLQQI